ncbi:cyclin-U1-1-like [Aristolochia californica]|uniref:cyclin-U1-1-like n=1 Tax=Aristolochia californica TaxID=171875 RepID=UPI0035DFD1E7
MLNGGGDEESEATTPRVVIVLSQVLERLVNRNDCLLESDSVVTGKGLSVFQGVRTPGISVSKYLERIYRYTNCSPSCFVVGFVYIDQLLHRHPDSLLFSLNVHRLLVTSIMVASKVLDDAHYNNAFYARVGGVTNSELNKLELELLRLLDFGVTVTTRVFDSYCLHLEKELLCNGRSRRIERLPFRPADGETEHAGGDSLKGQSSPTQAVN